MSRFASRVTGVVGLAALLILALNCSADSSDFDAFPLEGSWVDQGDSAHTLDVSQGEYLGEVGGLVSGDESFGPDGPTHAFEGTFLERQMDITIARPGGPAEFKGELLEDNLLLLTSNRADAFLFLRR